MSANNAISNTDQVTQTDRSIAGRQPDGSMPSGGETPSGGGDSNVPVGVIVMWAGLLTAIPNGWHLCDGASGTPDLRSMFIKGAAAGINPGITGGATQHTPAGTNSAPAFTGNSVTSSAASGGTPAGTIDAHTTNTLLLAAGATTFVTGPGTHTFTGTALGTHTHATTATGTVAAPTFSGTLANYEPAFYSLAYIQKL